jgi:peptide/nickel transport system substrate-binding protein
VLFVGIARSEEMTRRHPLMRLQGGLVGNRRFAIVELGALGESEYAELIAELTGGPVAPATVAQLREVTDANPLFTSELVRSLLESGRLAEGESGTFRLDAPTGHLTESLPESINDAVRQRLDVLPPELVEALETASVLGREFEFEQFEGLVAESSEGGDPDELADELVNRGLLAGKRQGREERLVFSSGVLRDVLHSGLSRRRRKLLHRRAAEHLERRFEGRETAVLPQLVLHYGEADASEKVVAYGLDLAERSLAARASEDAAQAARAVLDALAGEGAAELSTVGRARRLLAEALVLGLSSSDALREFEAAVRAFERAGETAEALATTARAARVAWEAQQTEEAQRWVARGLEAADRAIAPDAPEAARATADLLELGATIANLAGEYERAHLLLERAERLRPRPEGAGAKREVPRGGRLVVGLSAAVAARHPVRIRFGHESDTLANAYETLVTVDERGRLTGGLAESWTSEDDGRVFRFALREGVRLHDGRELTAELAREAIVAAIAAAGTRLPAGLAAIRGAAAGLSAKGAYELRIELQSAIPIYPAMLADPATAIAIPSGDGLAGTGPFRVQTLEADRVRMRRHEGAWRGQAHLDELEFRVIETSAERAEGLRFGQLDVVERLDAEQIREMASRSVDVRWIEVPQMTVTLLAINPEHPLARDREVLRAASAVATSPELVREAGGRLARPAEVLLPPGMLGHDANRRRTTTSVARAAEVLRGSGLALPIRLEVAVSPSLAEQHASLVAAMVARWGEIGIEATVAVLTNEEFLARLEAPGETGAILMRWRGDYPDPDGFLHPLFDRATGLLGWTWASAALDELMAAAREEPEPAARERAYFEVEAALCDRGLVVPLMHQVSRWAAGPRVRGLEARASAPHLSFESAGRAEVESRRTASDNFPHGA